MIIDACRKETVVSNRCSAAMGFPEIDKAGMRISRHNFHDEIVNSRDPHLNDFSGK